MSAAILEAGVRDRIAEAARWRLAGLLLRRPAAGRREALEALAREVRDPGLVAAVGEASGLTEGEYLALLGPGGPVSPREVSYRPIEDPGRLLAELAAYHEAFGYRPDAEDPRDHVAVAADFAGFLALKEAYARAAGRERDAEVTREARLEFVARHVRATARGMLRRLAPIGVESGYLPAALGALGELAGVSATPDPREEELGEAFLRPGLDSSSFQCGDVEAECGKTCLARDPLPS